MRLTTTADYHVKHQFSQGARSCCSQLSLRKNLSFVFRMRRGRPAKVLPLVFNQYSFVAALTRSLRCIRTGTDMATTTVTKTQTRTHSGARASTRIRTCLQRRKRESKVKDRTVEGIAHVRTRAPTRTPLSLARQQELECSLESSNVTIPATRATRSSIASLASEPSTSGPSGSGSGSKHTSTEASDRSRSSNDSGRKSSGSCHEVQLVEHVIDGKCSSDIPVRKEASVKSRAKETPTKLSLEKVQTGLARYQAVRESFSSHHATDWDAHEAAPTATYDLVELPQNGFDFASIPLTETPLPPLRRRNEDRPSPETLRQARLKQLSRTIHEIDDELSAPPVPRDHHCPPLLRGHHDAPKTPYNGRGSYSRPAATGAPDNGREPPSPGRVNRARRRANVQIRPASLAIDRIVNLADRGYVVDILPWVAVLNLPLDTATRRVVKRYLTRDRGATTTGLGSRQMYHGSGAGSTFEQWCYISRLNMADIGLDGRRRSNNAAGLDESKDERHNVVLVPMTASMAEDLRDRRYCKAGEDETVSRKRDLGGNIA